MNEKYVFDKIFEASGKLELMQVLIGDLINKTERSSDDDLKNAMYFSVQQSTIESFLHIALDGICYCIKLLDQAQEKGGEA